MALSCVEGTFSSLLSAAHASSQDIGYQDLCKSLKIPGHNVLWLARVSPSCLRLFGIDLGPRHCRIDFEGLVCRSLGCGMPGALISRNSCRSLVKRKHCTFLRCRLDGV